MSYSVSEAAERLGVTAETLRYADDMGYIEARRTPGNHRRYTGEMIEWIKCNRPDTRPESVRRAVLEIQTLTHWSHKTLADHAGLSQHTIWSVLHEDRIRHRESTARAVYGLLNRVKSTHRASESV